MSTYLEESKGVIEFPSEVVESIDIDRKENKIMITTISGRRFMFCHNQDCCESVTIVDVDGYKQEDLKGDLLQIDYETFEPMDYCDHTTLTNIRFVCNHRTMIVRWVGTSNGFYSETVSFCEIKP